MPSRGRRPTSERPERKRHAWPRVGVGGVEAAKWRAAIGYRLREWRRTENGMVLKTAAARSGLSGDAISRIERGLQRADLVEIAALAAAYRKTPHDVVALLVPPTHREWTNVLHRWVPDPRFTSAPRGGLQ